MNTAVTMGTLKDCRPTAEVNDHFAAITAFNKTTTVGSILFLY